MSLHLLKLYTDALALVSDTEALTADPAVAKLVADVEAVLADFGVVIPKPNVVGSVVLTDADKQSVADVVASLEGKVGANGKIIAAIIALIEKGVTNLPAILAALQAMGLTLPPWVNLIIQLLLAVTPKPTPTPAT